MKLYRELASLVDAFHRVNAGLHDGTFQGDPDWLRRHKARAELLTKHFMPSGSGVDCGTKIDVEASTGDRLVFQMDFHHMDSQGGYDGWTEHRVSVKASMVHEIDIRITGRDRNKIKEYLHDLAHGCLVEELDIKTIHSLYHKEDI